MDRALRTTDGFSAAFARHAPSMQRAALGILDDPADAQDVVQDVFLGLWSRPERFDPRRGDLGTYLRMVARSRALDRRRREQTARAAAERLQHLLVDPPLDEEGPPRAVERAATASTLRAGLGRLPAAQREAVVLAHVAGLSAEGIARRTATPVGTAKSRVRLGLERLRHDPDVRRAA